MYELWQTVDDFNVTYPFFLLDKGDFDEIYIKFKKNKNTVITDKKGKIIKSHIEIKSNE
jgi:hypothetical protein